MHFAAATLHTAGAWLAAAAPLDTLVTKPVPVDPGWLERITQVLHALLALALLVLAGALAVTAWNFRTSYAKVSALLDRVYADVAPITQHTTRIAENVDYLSTAVRADMDRVSALVARAEQRIDETLARAEARARDLEALLDVAQSQAQDSLVAAASTVAGVREGFAALRDQLVGVPHPGAPRVGDDLDVADEGFDDDDEPEAPPDVLRPRIRTRDS